MYTHVYVYFHAACAKSLQSYLTLCDPIDCSPRLLCLWDSPGKNTGDGCHALLQGIFPTQESKTQVSSIAGGFFTI